MTNLDIVKAACIKANPQILELGFEPHFEGKYEDGSIYKYSTQHDGILSLYKWKKNKKGYGYCMKSGKCLLMHRVILGFEIPNGFVIDHINGDKSDNRIENLRAVTMSQNHMNKGKFIGTSGYKGVRLKKDHKRAKPWSAELKIEGKVYCVGMFETAEEAGRAYDERAKFFYGEYARPNFPIGRSIRLADVLLAIEKETGNPAYDSIKAIECLDYWNLLEDSLENQSPETLAFLAELLK